MDTLVEASAGAARSPSEAARFSQGLWYGSQRPQWGIEASRWFYEVWGLGFRGVDNGG